jgi:hypothetical protein
MIQNLVDDRRIAHHNCGGQSIDGRCAPTIPT